MSHYQYFDGAGYDVAILPGGFSVALENDRPASKRLTAGRQEAPGITPATALPDGTLLGAGPSDIIPWGVGNDFPQRLVDLYSKDTIIPATLGKVASMLTGRGVMPVIEDVDANANEVARPLPPNDPVTREIKAFLNTNHFRTYLDEMAPDAAWFFNGFPEMLISKDRKKIVQLHPLNAEECRWGRMTDKGDLNHIYLNGNWPRGTVGDAYTTKIQAIDPYRFDAVDWLRESSFYNCVFPIRYPTPGKRFYSLAHHYSIIESGWLDIHLAVPEYKKFLFKNQMSIKYHIKVDKEYWEVAFGTEYKNGSDARKKELRQSWSKSVTDMLTNVENAGATLITETALSLDGKVNKDYVTITPVTDSMKDGKFIMDNLEAAANIFYALNVDPTLVGFSGGENSPSQSGGSNKREAYLIALQMLAPFRRMLLQPLEFVAEYNGWKAHFPDLTFRFRDTLLTTLDTGAGTQKTLS